MDVRFQLMGCNIHLVVDPQDHIGRVIATARTFYECEMLLDLARLLTAGQLVVDVGGNIGNHSVFFALVSECNVVCFEPNPSAIALLKRNIGLNGLDARIELREAAVGCRDGRAALVDQRPGNLGATRFSAHEDGEFALVTLDGIGFADRVSLIKIDVEGMDFEVLRGAERLIRESRPILAIECSASADYLRASDWLSRFGYIASGCYNATDTYVFLPYRGAEEAERVVRFLSHQQLRMQTQLRDLKASLKRLMRGGEAGRSRTVPDGGQEKGNKQ